jgi:hypothetical protein
MTGSATKQSIFSPDGVMDCFADARNDEKYELIPFGPSQLNRRGTFTDYGIGGLYEPLDQSCKAGKTDEELVVAAGRPGI